MPAAGAAPPPITAATELLMRVDEHCEGEEALRPFDVDEDGAVTLRTLARTHAARRREEEAAKAVAAAHAREVELREAADRTAAAALASEAAYIDTITAQVGVSVAAGFVDHTRQLTPRALQRLYRQMQRYDRTGRGRLGWDGFQQLCARVASAQGDVELHQLQLMALFTQADVTGERAICASQWCWARAQLAGLLSKARQLDEQRAAREASKAAEVERQKQRRNSVYSVGVGSRAAAAAAQSQGSSAQTETLALTYQPAVKGS